MRLPSSRARHLLLAGAAAGLVVAYFLLRDVLPEIDLEELLDDVARTLGDWTYLLVGVLAFLETGAFVGLVAPGETFVILGGAVAGVGETSVVLTIAIVWFSAWAGDSVSFYLGRRLGRDFILRHGSRVRITPERFGQVEGYFSRHGGKTILLGRFIGIVRALAPFIAGSSGMRYGGFAPYSILGTGIWGAGFTLLGYFGARSIEQAADIAGTGTLVFGIVIGTIVAIVLVARFLRVPENRARVVAAMERRPLLRTLVVAGRRVRPQARFVWNRITPGGLGLELTSLIAALSVGLFVFVAYILILNGDAGPTPGDETALDVARDLRVAWLDDLARTVTELGSLAVTLPFAAAGALLLAARGRWAEAVVVALAMAITVVAVPEVKDAVDRSRPQGGLIDASGDAYPSGHAAHSVVYAWAGITAGIRLRPGVTARTVVIAVGIALAAAVGLSRVYLGVHYLSDVSGGWGLGVATFALCGAVAVIVTHIRQNAGGIREEPTAHRNA